jgi:hypothetical protein
MSGVNLPQPMADFENRRMNLNVEHQAESNRARFMLSIDKVKKAHPEIDPQMLDNIGREYAAATQNLASDIKALTRRTPNGAPPDSRWMSQQVELLQGEQSLVLQRQVERKYGPQGVAALQMIGEENREKGIVGGLLSKLGTTGGMIGAGAGGLLAFLAMGGMGGGIMSIIAGLVGIVGGGMLGNSVGDMVSGGSNSPSNALAAQAAGQSRGLARGNSPVNDRSAGLSAADTGTMASPASPRTNIPTQGTGVTYG